MSYFKFKDFWKYLIRTKSWPDKQYTKQKTARMLENLFGAKEVPGKINNKSVRYIGTITTRYYTDQLLRKDKMKEPPFA